ncbi:MAG: beta-aspartyl-peptidase [Flavobacteriaceae bacterium]|nr:beta-aspartyl-peptidase [Flavobacteriaceae bacterium]
MLKLIKNSQLYTPKFLGVKDILIAGDKIIAIDDNLDQFSQDAEVWDAQGKMVTPGFIDQHIHISGAGGKDGFSSRTPDVDLKQLISCGSTTVMGLLGTDGTSRSLKSLFSKVKALKQQGISAYMLCGYYGVESPTLTDDIQSDMIFIDPVLGCKIAISDIRSSYPTALELLRKLRDVRVAGSLSNKKGILHVHLGDLDTKLDVLFDLVKKYQFPIEHISPTHVARTKALFDQAIEFGKLGGMIDITTGASKYTEPHKAVLYALEQGLSIDKITFSTDGHAGLTNFNENGQPIGVKIAQVDKNLEEVVNLIKTGFPMEEALKLITTNPATNLGLKNKGQIAVGFDADLCCFDADYNLMDVFALGQQMMIESKLTMKKVFES